MPTSFPASRCVVFFVKRLHRCWPFFFSCQAFRLSLGRCQTPSNTLSFCFMLCCVFFPSFFPIFSVSCFLFFPRFFACCCLQLSGVQAFRFCSIFTRRLQKTHQTKNVCFATMPLGPQNSISSFPAWAVAFFSCLVCTASDVSCQLEVRAGDRGPQLPDHQRRGHGAHRAVPHG